MIEPLDREALRAVFEHEVVPDYLESQWRQNGGSPPGPPRFVSVGGQPGAGKGGVMAAMKRGLPGSVAVNGDELRVFHPAYERLMLTDPLRMPEVTAPASGPWVGMSNDYLRQRGVSAVVETTLRDAAMLRREFEAFKAAGYETELRVVAVPLEVSRLGTLSRYVEQVKDFGAGRWTPGAAHDEAAANVRATVAELVASGAVDRVVVQDRDGRVFHDADGAGGGTQRGEAAALAVDHARDVRNLSRLQAQSWIEIAVGALRDRVRLGHDAPDLVRVSTQLATTDAAAVIARAHPGDDAAQREAMRELTKAAVVPLQIRIERDVDAHRAGTKPEPTPARAPKRDGRGF